MFQPDVRIETVELSDFERPGGRRDALIYAILASIDWTPPLNQASAVVKGRIVGATEQEIKAAIMAVGVALVGQPPAPKAETL